MRDRRRTPLSRTWSQPRGGLVLAAIAVLLATADVSAAVLFEDGFDSCNASRWDFDIGGSGAVVSTGCLDGCCGRKTIPVGACDAGAFWEKEIHYSGERIWVSGWWKFPTNWRFAGGVGDPCQQSGDFKAILFETYEGGNRLYLNFRSDEEAGPLPQARLAFISGGTDEYWLYGDPIRADDQWHHIEVLLHRVTNGGSVKIWLDGRLIVDDPSYVLCTGACKPINSVKFGAYQNWASPATQSFFFDSAAIATEPPDYSSWHNPGSGSSGSGSGSNGSPGDTPLGSASGNECAEFEPEWLVCDGFENGSLAYWNDDLNQQNGRLSVSSAGPVRGDFMARMSHTSGSPSGAWGAKFFGDHPLGSGGQQQNDIHFRVQSRFSSLEGLASDSAKIAIVAAFESWGASYPGPNSWAPYYATLFVDTDGRFKMETHSKIGGSTWRGYEQNVGQPVEVQEDRWHEIQVHLKLNTPGQTNGILEYWIDGEKKAEYDDVDFRKSYSARGWNHFLISADQTPVAVSHQQDWDTIVVSRGWIAPFQEGPPVGDEPLPAVSNVYRTDTSPTAFGAN